MLYLPLVSFSQASVFPKACYPYSRLSRDACNLQWRLAYFALFVMSTLPHEIVNHGTKRLSSLLLRLNSRSSSDMLLRAPHDERLTIRDVTATSTVISTLDACIYECLQSYYNRQLK